MSLRRTSPDELKGRLDAAEPVLVLDVRRPEAFRRHPSGIAGAIPLLLDVPEPQIPDVPRETPVVAYCLCSGQASSTRAARWLEAAGYTDVAVLTGGLPAWEAAGFRCAPIHPDDARRIATWITPPRQASGATGGSLIAESAFLAGEQLPARRDMAVLFVDMVDSTQLLFMHSPEEMLGLVQAFMEIVVDVAVRHCGDVHDFEGDGAMLYFAGVGEALPAAFNLRTALNARRRDLPELPQARFALDAGPLVIGHVGAVERRGLSFIGPSVNAAARILKLAPPGGIVATQRILSEAWYTDPDLAARFVALPEQQLLKGWQEPVSVYVAADSSSAADVCQDCRS